MRGNPIINAALIAQVLEASHLPSQVGITHCKAHQTDSSIITKNLAQALNIHWRFHIPYHPQSSGKVEHGNRTLKNALTKLSLELHLDWTKLLPLVLLCLWALPKRPLMLSPFELLYGHLLLPIMVQLEPPNLYPTLLNPLLTFLLSLLWSHAHDQLPQPSDTTKITPSLQMGDLVFLPPIRKVERPI
jgi:hypothetical protein